MGVFMEISIIFTIIKIISSVIKSIKRNSSHNFFKNNVVVTPADNHKKNKYTDISLEELSIFNTDDLESFKNYFYKIFLNFENAYNNLDYNVMRNLSTKQLFNNYYTGITLDLEKGNKKIITNIQKKNVIIYETFSSTVKQVVSAMIEISYINYTINKQGYVVSGSRDFKKTEKFEVVFRKDFDTKEITNCPNCGAKLSGHKCEFCRSSIKTNDFKISSIKKIVN
jgi:predicted lipid-binding transport protein (Tim44 family)